MSISELSLGMKGGLIFLLARLSQFNFSNQGCSFIYFEPLCPSLALGSFFNSFFSRSCNLGENCINIIVPCWDRDFYIQSTQKATSGFSSWKGGILSPSHEWDNLNTTSPHRRDDPSFLWSLVPNTQEFHISMLQIPPVLGFWIDQSLWAWCIRYDQWWCFQAWD